MKNRIKSFWHNQGGMGVVEVILIIIVLIGLVLIFKEELTNLLQSLFKTISGNAKKVG